MEIIQRRGYYYLHYTRRKGNKILTKDTYLGKEIPKDIEKIKAALLKKLNAELYSKLNYIKKSYWAEWSKYPPSIKEKMLKELDINFTYNTNAIEGSTITLEETEDILHRQIAPNKPLRDIKETISHSKTFLEMLDEKEDLSESLILKWHYSIFHETKQDIAGKYRDYLVKVGDYRCPDWQDIKGLMNASVEFYKKNLSMNPVELSAIIHYRFEKIHPFGDGNGRLGRLISNFILHKNKYPLLVIEYKKRSSYYRALNKREEDFVKYFIRRYISIYKHYLNN